jgi:hypothetical protein
MRYGRGLFEDAGNDDRQDYSNNAHIRELYGRLDNLSSTVDSLSTQVNETLLTDTVAADTAPPMTNFVDNSDFTLSHYAYSLASDITSYDILAKWYARPQSDTGIYHLNTVSTESDMSVRSADSYGDVIAYTSISSNTISLDNDPTVLSNGMPVKISGSSLGTGRYYVINATTTSIQLEDDLGGTTPVTVTAAGGGNITLDFNPYDDGREVIWDTSTATLATSGGNVVASPLTSKYVFLGNLIYVKMSLAHKPREFTINTSTDISTTTGVSTITSNAHNLLDGTAVYFPEPESGNALPPGVSANTGYHIYSKTTNTFQIVQTESVGPGLDLSGGTGSITMKTRVKSGLTARVSLLENTGGEIFYGAKPTLTLQKIGSHTGGTTTRNYILEVQMPSGRRFYSNISSPATVTNTVATDSVDNDDYVSISWDKIVGASRYNVYRQSGSGDWYLLGATNSSTNLIYDYGAGSITFTPPTFTSAKPTDSQVEYMRAEAIIENATNDVSTGELVTVELNSSIQFPTDVTNFADKGDQLIQVEFFNSDGTNTTLKEIPLNSLLIDKVSLSYVYGRWHPSSRDQALTPDKVIPTAAIASGGTGDGTGTAPSGGGGGTTTGGGNQCVHRNTPILMWSDDGQHFYMPASDIVLGDRLVSWDGEKIVPSRVVKITPGISRMNYRIYAGDNELVCSFSHRIIADFADFPKGTNVGRLDKTTVIYKDGTAQLAEIEGLESFSGAMQVLTFKMEKGLENYVSAGIFSHNRKDEYDFEQ